MARPRDPETPAQQVCLRSLLSRNATSKPSPGSSTPGSSHHHRSPRTPLPRVTLTPRRTPNRPGLPSPIQDLGLLPCSISLTRKPMSNEMSDASPVARKRAPESPLERCRGTGRPTLEYGGKKDSAPTAQTKTDFKSAEVNIPGDSKRNSYMPMQDWYCNSPPTNQTLDSHENPSIPTSVGGIRSSSNNSHNMSTDGRSSSSRGTPEVKTRSLLAPPKNDDMMRAMANEFAPSIDDDSLTDEDEPFLLCDPAVLVEERKSSSRSRQRPRRNGRRTG